MRILVVGILISCLAAGLAHAQAGVGTGPIVGIHARHASALHVEGIIDYMTESGDRLSAYEEQAGAGSGFGVLLGYRWAGWLMVFADWSRTRHPGQRLGSVGDHTLDELEVGVRVGAPAAWWGLAPYLSGGVGRRALHATLDRARPMPGEQSLWGRDVRFGGGVQWSVRPTWGLDAGVAASYGEFDRLRMQQYTYDTNAAAVRMTRLHLGLRWHPAAADALAAPAPVQPSARSDR